jgi:glycosyltransferase involved in cell wall biosynthesis
LANILRREEVDLVHAHQYTPFFYSLIARLFHRKSSILFTEHGRHFPDHRRPKRVVINRLLLERRDRVVGVGQAVRRALINNEGIPAQRIGVIYNGIEMSRNGHYGQHRDAVRRELGLNREDFVVVHVARLDYLKDHHTALRTLRRAIAQRPNVKLLLVGEGPEQPAIEQQIDKDKLAANVRLLGLRHDVKELLRASDLFLLTSISEGIPLTILEAMAAGLPVVATAVGGVPEIVINGETGLLAPAHNDDGLAAHILCLADDPQLCRQMGHSGQERAREYFSEDHMHHRYLKLYREMLNA